MPPALGRPSEVSRLAIPQYNAAKGFSDAIFHPASLDNQRGAAVLSNDQLSCTITENGIQSISLAGRVVTTQPTAGFPTHQGFYASNGVPPAAGTAAVGPVLKSVLTSTPAAVTVTDVCSNMAITYTYWLSGDDIDMEAVLKNNDTRPFSNIMIAPSDLCVRAQGLGKYEILGHQLSGRERSDRDASQHVVSAGGFVCPGRKLRAGVALQIAFR